MRPVARYRSQLLMRKSYKPRRSPRSPVLPRVRVVARPAKFGIKPTLMALL